MGFPLLLEGSLRLKGDAGPEDSPTSMRDLLLRSILSSCFFIFFPEDVCVLARDAGDV